MIGQSLDGRFSRTSRPGSRNPRRGLCTQPTCTEIIATSENAPDWNSCVPLLNRLESSALQQQTIPGLWCAGESVSVRQLWLRRRRARDPLFLVLSVSAPDEQPDVGAI